MLRRQKHAFSQSTTPFACTLLWPTNPKKENDVKKHFEPDQQATQPLNHSKHPLIRDILAIGSSCRFFFCFWGWKSPQGLDNRSNPMRWVPFLNHHPVAHKFSFGPNWIFVLPHLWHPKNRGNFYTRWIYSTQNPSRTPSCKNAFTFLSSPNLQRPTTGDTSNIEKQQIDRHKQMNMRLEEGAADRFCLIPPDSGPHPLQRCLDNCGLLANEGCGPEPARSRSIPPDSTTEKMVKCTPETNKRPPSAGLLVHSLRGAVISGVFRVFAVLEMTWLELKCRINSLTLTITHW